jgi:hypothetical protein
MTVDELPCFGDEQFGSVYIPDACYWNFITYNLAFVPTPCTSIYRQSKVGICMRGADVSVWLLN